MRIAASWFWISLFGPTACKYVATMTQATGSGLRLVSCYLVVQVGSFRGGLSRACCPSVWQESEFVIVSSSTAGLRLFGVVAGLPSPQGG